VQRHRANRRLVLAGQTTESGWVGFRLHVAFVRPHGCIEVLDRTGGETGRDPVVSCRNEPANRLTGSSPEISHDRGLVAGLRSEEREELARRSSGGYGVSRR
jgi:hypothetical protein